MLLWPAVASGYVGAVLIWQAATARAGAKDIWNVPESQLASAAVAQVNMYKVFGLHAAAARAAAFVSECSWVQASSSRVRDLLVGFGMAFWNRACLILGIDLGAYSWTSFVDISR